MPYRSLTILACLMSLVSSVQAQSEQQSYENLQLLPADISRDSLQAVMSTYSSALGVRCSHCHVQKRGRRDFASDDKPSKSIARAMMRLTADINRTLRAEAGDSAVRVECVTCHHGASSPRTLQGELRQRLGEDGIDAAIARYEQLRSDYYGRSTYDFGENSLIDLAGDLARSGDDHASIEMLRLNLTYFPESVFTLAQLAGALHRVGATNEARMRLQEAMRRDPDSRYLQRQQQQLFGKPSTNE